MITESLQAKIYYSLQLIRRSEPVALRYQDFGAVVAFSGGKDSVVLADLVKRSGIKHKLIHNLTTLDPPEVVHFVRDCYPECIIRRPKETFWQLVERHRFLPSRQYRYCCAALKEQGDAQTLTFTGVRNSESAYRKKRTETSIYTRRRHPSFVNGTFDSFIVHSESEVQCLRGLDKLVVNPILSWTDDDVWTYIRHFNLPYCKLYDEGFKRVGCLFCPLSSYKSIMQEVELYPKYYEAYLRLIGRLKEVRLAQNDNDTWQGLTPAQIFDYHASKLSIKRWRELHNVT